jgi:Uma2 family endonuclease
MSPIGAPHGGAVNRIANLLTVQARGRAIVATQNPVRLSTVSEPEPDIALLKLRDDFYAAQHPGPEDVLLLIEVAETSLRYDRDRKLPLYALAGIPEVWLVDLAGRTLWCCRDPAPAGYGTVERAGSLATLRPRLLPDCSVDLRGLF